MAWEHQKSGTTIFFDIVRHILILSGTCYILFLIWKHSWVFGLLAVVPVYLIMLNLFVFLTKRPMFNPFYVLMGFCLKKLGGERWWMTHGIGSVGSVAKSMAKAYSRAKVAYPTASQDEILFVTLRSRYTVVGINNLTAAELAGMVKNSEGRLAALSLQVMMLENPAAKDALLFYPQIYAMMVDVIEEVTAKFAVDT